MRCSSSLPSGRGGCHAGGVRARAARDRRGERVRKPHNWLITIAHNECRRHLSIANRVEKVELEPSSQPSRSRATGDGGRAARGAGAAPFESSARRWCCASSRTGRTRRSRTRSALGVRRRDAALPCAPRCPRAARRRDELSGVRGVARRPVCALAHPRTRACLRSVRDARAAGARAQERAEADRLRARSAVVGAEGRGGGRHDGDRRRGCDRGAAEGAPRSRAASCARARRADGRPRCSDPDRAAAGAPHPAGRRAFVQPSGREAGGGRPCAACCLPPPAGAGSRLAGARARSCSRAARGRCSGGARSCAGLGSACSGSACSGSACSGSACSGRRRPGSGDASSGCAECASPGSGPACSGPASGRTSLPLHRRLRFPCPCRIRRR